MKKISLRFEVRRISSKDASPSNGRRCHDATTTIREYLITSMKRTLSDSQSANTKKPRMGSNESKQSEKQSNDTKMTEEKMDVVATGEGKNRTT